MSEEFDTPYSNTKKYTELERPNKHKRISAFRTNEKPRRQCIPVKKVIKVMTKNIVDLNGWIFIPGCKSQNYSINDSVFFKSLDDMDSYIRKYHHIYDIYSILIPCKGSVCNDIGVEDLRCVSIYIGSSMLDVGYCFSRYDPSVFEEAKKRAML